jgi:hypothetical protein
MSLLVETFKFFGYSGAGFLAGYQVCKIRRNTEEIKEAVVPENDNEEPTWPAVERRKESRRTDRMTRFIGIFVIILSIATVGQSFYFSHQQSESTKREQKQTDCQAKYNEDFARAVTIRGQYADEDRAQLYKMISTVISEPDASKRRQAVEDWVTATKKNDELRKSTPLPNLQARNCGGS